LDPNNADHILVNNASNGAHVYESNDGGKTYHGCLDRRGAVMIAVDRKGWFYTGSEAGLFRNRNGCGNNSEWELLFVRRQWRRMNHTEDRAAHDYQRINIDFAGGMAFGSDQGMFVMNGTELQMYSACGDLNNNVIMHPAIAEAETPGETCIVTALWDWSPVASWDSGKHWPSWQTPDDGTSMGYFGEGGGCFGVGQSKHVLCMHHHDVGYSSRCGKNMSRLIIPNGASAAGPTFERKQGSRSEPNGMIYALMSMGTPQFQTLTDKAVTCDGVNGRGDLGVSTSYQCLSMIDIGMVYNWYSGANVAVWRGDTDKHCHLCKLSGSQPSWNMTDTKGAIVFAFDKDAKVQKPRFNKVKEDNNGEYSYDGKGSDDHRAMYKFNKHVAKEARLEMGQEEEAPPFSTDLVPLGGNPFWLLKSFNFGANFMDLAP